MLHKYFYLGYVYPSVPKPWVPIVKEMIERIDKKARSKYMPRFILNWVKYLAMGNSVYYIKNRFWYWVLLKINWGIYIHDIKDKYAELRVYGAFSDETYEIIEWAEKECELTCENCGSRSDVKICGSHWYYNLCIDCRLEKGLK